MKRLTKKYVVENTSISRVYSANGSTLEGCRFQTSAELANRRDDRLFLNLEKWGWVVNKGRLCITWEGLRNLKMI